jgi:hypothetical protein|tara:strand:+ start:6633 stop:7403 length:771 start_codon:yes stop_codon:yes gene_type:complete
MSTESIVINEPDANMSLEEEAASKGLDTNGEPVQKAETEEQNNTEDRPEWLPDKFKSPEDMAQAYKELETKLGSNDKQTKEAEETAEAAVESAGLDFETMSEEYYENDGLSDATYKKLADGGIPREIVDQYIAGQKAAGEVTKTELLETAGGEEQYSEMTNWAADAFSDGEIDAFNDAINQGNSNMARMAIAGLKARYDAANSSEPSRTISGSEPRDGSVYRSVAELMEDMGNPKYHNDDAFRSDVERKLARSDIM